MQLQLTNKSLVDSAVSRPVWRKLKDFISFDDLSTPICFMSNDESKLSLSAKVTLSEEISFDRNPK